MFPGSVSEYTENQAKFCKWMMFYDMVYQSEDCPDEEIIQSNRHIDQWFENKIKQQEQERRKYLSKMKGVDMKSAYNHSNVVVF